MALAGAFPAQGFRIPHSLLAYDVVDSAWAENGRVSWPSGIVKGDLLLGYHLSDANAVFSGNGGLTSFIVRHNVSPAASGTGIICGKVADGTESGAIGGLSNQSSPYFEVIEVLRFNRPVASVSAVQAEGQVRNAAPADAVLSSDVAGTPAKFVIASFAARDTFNGNGTFTGGSDFSNEYKNLHALKTRGKLFSLYTALPAITCTLEDKGYDTSLLAVQLELT